MLQRSFDSLPFAQDDEIQNLTGGDFQILKCLILKLLILFLFSMLQKLPNILTISRILVVPGMAAVYLLLPGAAGYWGAALLFLYAALTDFFDGWLARRLGAQSAFGTMLDPIADKLLVAVTLLLLIHHGPAPLVPTLLILSREILVSGLREHLGSRQISLPVTGLAKWKTAIQLAALNLLLLGPEAPSWLLVYDIPALLLWGAALVTVVTGWDYWCKGLHAIKDPGA